MNARDHAMQLAEDDLRRLFDIQRFEVVSVQRSTDWLGRERFVIDADVGFELARARVVVDPGRGRVIERCNYAYPVPYDELPLIGADEARALARAEVERRGWCWRGRVEAKLRRPWFGRPWWYVRTNADWRGMNAEVGVDARTKVVIGRGYMPR